MESISLKKLAQKQKLTIKGKATQKVQGLSTDSRKVKPGDLFIARKGLSVDGAEYIDSARRAGAVAILTDTYDPFLSLPQLIHPSPETLIAPLAATFFQNPSKSLFCVGVTGSKGKTTTTYYTKHLLEPAGLIGTIETILPNKNLPSQLTTHDSLYNQTMLKEMLDQGFSSAVLEVSSHGLVQHRVDAIDFDIAVFTNLFPDHLDYHGDMESYFLAKRRLMDKAKITLVHLDDPYALRMQQQTKGYTFSSRQEADFFLSKIRQLDTGYEAECSFLGEKTVLFLPVLGEHNLNNLLAAMATAILSGRSIEQTQEALLTVPAVPGRLERVPLKAPFSFFVDFAHTGEALKVALRTLRPLVKGRLIVVFGCGGNRDPLRRKGMAEAASSLADLIILTSDNPRKEDPEAIIREILQSFPSKEKVLIDMDRKEAIQKALAVAEEGDGILVAGKGHEKTQIFATQTIPFDDVEVAKELFLMQK